MKKKLFRNLISLKWIWLLPLSLGVIFTTIFLLPSKHIDYFEPAFAFVTKNEGGYDDDTDDRGGETFMGISKASYPNLDIKNLKIKDVKEIYRKDYWESTFVSKIKNELISIKMFDLCVLMGENQAGVIFQRCLNAAGHQVFIDGEIGEQSMSAFAKIQNIEGFLWLLRAEAISFFTLLVKQNSSQSKFFKGWVARVFRNPK